MSARFFIIRTGFDPKRLDDPVSIEKTLRRLAREARAHAKADESGFKVGAAGLVQGPGTKPAVVLGWNDETENGNGLHAEDSMVAKMAPNERFLRLLVVGQNEQLLTPCGNCRDVLAKRTTEVSEILIQPNPSTPPFWFKVNGLLPNTHVPWGDITTTSADSDDHRLFTEALRLMKDRPYNPHRQRKFEAVAILSREGNVYPATSLPNASYHNQSAVGSGIGATDSARERYIVKVLSISSEQGLEKPVFPSGRCLQQLYEFGQVHGNDIAVIAAHPSGKSWLAMLSNLFPYPFGPRDVGINVAQYT
ncbi:MAG: hypothetical protein NT099_09265 [Candidatus Saganbacteria bacterium]|nr:hypothetical protein [Candidatus Saganbacteria bacterium]